MGYINFSVDAVGMDDVLKMLDAVDNIPGRAQAALNEAAQIVLGRERDLAPVRTGELKNDLKIGRRKKSQDRSAVEVGIFYPDSPQAHLVESGHGGPKPAPAQPFMEPAIEMSEADVMDVIMAALTREI